MSMKRLFWHLKETIISEVNQEYPIHTGKTTLDDLAVRTKTIDSTAIAKLRFDGKVMPVVSPAEAVDFLSDKLPPKDRQYFTYVIEYFVDTPEQKDFSKDKFSQGNMFPNLVRYVPVDFTGITPTTIRQYRVEFWFNRLDDNRKHIENVFLRGAVLNLYTPGNYRKKPAEEQKA